ncbi:MAG: hypothetical protein E6Q88_12355 [Lysobacteraceae bacterium]|nr:MAG: hypothetical protein E6Q88_12355 [Xanthomonadaceae bacterium]
MRRALEEGSTPKTGQERKAGDTRQETPAQRAQRLANEASLQRVPDNPGGLLREKFKLEQERRRRGGDR